MEKMRALAPVVAVSWTLSSSPTFADWQWTRWGMAVEDVIAASKNAAIATTPAEKKENATVYAKPELKVPYTTNGMEFIAYFMFDFENNKLMCVQLKLIDINRTYLLKYLMTMIYGKPDVQSSNNDIGMTSNTWYREDAISSFVMDPAPSLKTKGFGSVHYCSRQYMGL
jgi:hypothetical protein